MKTAPGRVPCYLGRALTKSPKRRCEETMTETSKIETLQPLSPKDLEDIGDVAFNAIKAPLSEKGFVFSGGVSGGSSYWMSFKKDNKDILGSEKPIELSIKLPFSTEQIRHVSNPKGRIKHGSLDFCYGECIPDSEMGLLKDITETPVWGKMA